MTWTKHVNGIASDCVAIDIVRVSSASILDLHAEGVTGRFDRQHIQDIHLRIFGEVYDWAGEFRDIQIWKGGTEFAAPDEIPDKLDALCSSIQKAGYFQGLDRIGTANALADIMADLNLIHPFRVHQCKCGHVYNAELIDEYIRARINISIKTHNAHRLA